MKYSGTMIGSDNPKALGEFYTKILGKPGFQEGDWYGWKNEAQLMIGAHSAVKGQNDTPQRIMLSFEAPDVKAEFEKLAKAGAQVVAEPYKPDETQDMWLATLADPDGNYFQLAAPWQ